MSIALLFVLSFLVGAGAAFVVRGVVQARHALSARHAARLRELDNGVDTVPPTRLRIPANGGPYRAPAERRPSEPELMVDEEVRRANTAHEEARAALAYEVMLHVLEHKLQGEELVVALRGLLDAGVTHLEATDALNRANAKVTTDFTTAHVSQVMADALGRRRLLS